MADADERTELITFPIDATMIMLLERALGNDDFTWADAGDGPLPPTFPQLLAHFDPAFELRPRSDVPWFGSGGSPGFARPSAPGGSRMHAEQHYDFEREVRVGEVLFATKRVGDTWEKQGSGAKTLEFTERIVEFRDAEGDLVVTSRSVSVLVKG